MITINVLIKKKFGLVPHPRIKNRYTTAFEDCEEAGCDFGASVTCFTKRDFVRYLRKGLNVLLFTSERGFYNDGRKKEPRDSEWFKNITRNSTLQTSPQTVR